MEVLTWNVQGGRGVDGRVDLDRIAAVIRGGGEPDVLCLQEIAQGWPDVDGGLGADQPAELAARFPDHAPFFGPAVDRIGEDGARRRFGNLVLSRLPVEQVFLHPLPQPAEPAVRHMPRQATEVVVRDGAACVRVITLHLEFHARSQRGPQVERILALQREACGNAARPPLADPSGPYAASARPPSAIVCGDFNFRADAPEYAAATAAADPPEEDFTDAWTHLHGPGSHRPTCGIFDRDQWPEGPHCRDFFLVTPDLLPRVAAVEVDEETDASDHQPVRLRLAPGAA